MAVQWLSWGNSHFFCHSLAPSSGAALGNSVMLLRRVVRATSGAALGNSVMLLRRVVRATSGAALGNSVMLLRRVVRATLNANWHYY
jgi:hypothetical protein